MAQAAGVSTATASFVLNGRDGRSGGSPDARRRVRAAAAELGYAPNQNARAMRTGRSDSILLALGDVRDPWAAQLASEVSERASVHGLSTVVLVDEGRWDEFLLGHLFAAAFVTALGTDPQANDRVTALARAGVNVVAFSPVLQPDGLDVVSSWPDRAVGEAIDLLQTRHPRIHFLMAAPGAGWPQWRLHWFCEAMRARGVDPEPLVHVVGGDMAQARRSAAMWLEGEDRPRAVVCQTGYVALALQAAAIQTGVRVPEDLELVSIGDVPEAASLFGPITYFGAERVFERISEAILRRALRGPGAPWTREVLPWQLHQGVTTLPSPH